MVANAEKLNIRTIDGLSAQLNRSMPVTSGLGGGALIADDASRLYAEAVDDLYGLIPKTPAWRGSAGALAPYGEQLAALQ